ncbi:MAG: hypothetical protein H0X66_19965 [Verrucomicrobia bacterium]|nr:hypothetical protein [Verrucomicrobiota bacterium]
MKAFLLIISLALNCALALAILTTGFSTTETDSPKPIRTKVLTRTIIEEVEQPVGTNTVSTEVELFHWSSIRSTNFVEYAEKLREIECPDQTIRDIITGEINDWILGGRRALFAPYASRFWQFAAKGDIEMPDELKLPLGELKKAKAESLSAALKLLQKPAEPAKSRLEIVPEEIRGQIQEIEKKYADLRKEIQNNKELSSTDQYKRIQELERQREAERQGAMSPEELAEYKARRESSQFQQLYGFNADEKELREIASVFAKNSLWAHDPDFPSDREGKETRAKQRDEELKAMLGEKRFAEFKRASEPDYREAYKITQAYNLPDDAAVRAYEMNQELKAQKEVLRKNPSLTSEQRDALLQELQDATDDAAAELYGEKVARTLRRIWAR